MNDDYEKTIEDNRIEETCPLEIIKKDKLPIEDYKGEIQKTVKNNKVTIITAETGSGKSTQVPQYLREIINGDEQIIITQPRRLAARTVSKRVADEMGSHLGREVGYRTGQDRCDSRDTKILFCTDGLQLIRELTGTGKAKVLVIDEVHEWNTNIETLVAWSKKQIDSGSNLKVVIMSATLEAEKLSKYFGDCPTITAPGRLYPVEKKSSSSSISSEIKTLVTSGKNILVFQPGKKDIDATIRELDGVNAEILPLHGELEPHDQQKCFSKYDRPKVVVSTNIAQTSITIPDIDAVVDSGMERRIEVRDGVEGLYLSPISMADSEQRAGRAGRTKEGTYILCGNESRNDWPTPEIMRSRLDQLVLRLATAGIDATELEFFHQPDKKQLVEAKNALTRLGAFNEKGQVTEIGRKISELPVDVHIARMIIEANKLGVTNEIITIAACLEAGGIRHRNGQWKEYFNITEKESDLLAELEVYDKLKNSKVDFRETGVIAKNYFRAKEIRNRLKDIIRPDYFDKSLDESRLDILKSICAGMIDHLYQNKYGQYQNGGSGARDLARESVLSDLPQKPDWIVGKPFDLEITNRRGRRVTLNLVGMATKVNPEWLAEIAPQLARNENRNYRFDKTRNQVVCDKIYIFNNQEFKTEIILACECPEATNALAKELAFKWINSDEAKITNKELGSLYNKSAGLTYKPLDIDKVTEIYTFKLGNIFTLDQIKETNLDLSLKRDMFISDEDVKYINSQNPDTVNIGDEISDIKYFYQPKGSWTSEKHSITIMVSIDTIKNITQQQIENLIPSGNKYELEIKDEKYSKIRGTSVAVLKEQIEDRRLEIAWEDFQVNNSSNRIEIKGLEPLPELPEPIIYDEITGSLAYPAYNISWGNYYIKWFQKNEEAEKSRKEALDTKIKLDIETDEKLNRDRYVAEAQIEANKTVEMLSQVDMDEYETYGLNEDEAGRGYYSSRSLAKQIEEANNLLKTEDGYYKRTPEPNKSLVILKNVQARIEKALDYKERNSQMKEKALSILDKIDKILEYKNEIENAGDNSLSNDDLKKLNYELRDKIKNSIDKGSYLPAIEKSEEFKDLIEKAEKAKIYIDELVSSGEIYINFTAWHRRGGASNNGDGWVIRPDGSIRNHDSDDILRYKHDGNLTWSRVMPDEIAIRWRCSSNSDVAKNSQFEIVKRPKNELTKEQMERVAEIEREINAPEGAFGLNLEIVERNNKRLEEIQSKANEFVKNLDYSYQEISSNNGVSLPQLNELFEIYNHNGDFSEYCDGRNAQLLLARSAADGILEFLGYEKYGQTNFVMRWRKLKEGEQPPIKQSSEEKTSLFSLADLKAKFGKI